MQITNSVVCGASKGCIYKQIKPPLVGDQAFPPTGLVCRAAHVTGCILTLKNDMAGSLSIRGWRCMCQF